MNILLLFGGQSHEHEVSLISASCILKELIALHHKVYIIAINKKGEWQLSNSAQQIERSSKKLPLSIPLLNKLEDTQYNDSLENWKKTTVWTVPSNGVWYNLCHPKKLNIDCAFPVVHGYSGEDGKIQSLLEIAHIAYTGCRCTASVVGMNKHLFKVLLKKYNLPTLDSLILPYSLYLEKKEYYIKECITKITFPMLIKPTDAGSSIGIYTADTKEELIIAIEKCFTYTDIALIEKYLHPIKEIETSVIKKGNKIETFPPGELRILNAKIYDYAHKYEDASSSVQIIIPAQLDEKILNKIQTLSKKVFIALDCDGYARIDFFVSDDNTIYINEINTIPGFTKKSLFPLIVGQQMPKKELLQYLIDSAIEVHEQSSHKRV